MTEDSHHCKCFKISPNQKKILREKLEKIQFEDTPFQLEQGQEFGLIKKLENDKQIHIRVMPSCEIHSEIEPSIELPFAHINSDHSYSAHKEVQYILHYFGIHYTRNWSVPISCIRPIIKEPFKPTHIKTIVGVVFAVVLFVGIMVLLAKSSKA
ncbi:MAG: hypothetical protein HY223_06365 [Thaumarchaeota archaeon]|nr:hypothetical protein [Nitrososphaerota archaeon]